MAQVPVQPGGSDDLVDLFSSTEASSPSGSDADPEDALLAITDAGITGAGGEAFPNAAIYEDEPTDASDSPTELTATYAPVDEIQDDGGPAEDDAEVGLSTITSPDVTVSVSATAVGATQRVVLSPELRDVTEAGLAEEIVALADLARLKALAGQLTALVDDPVLADAARGEGLDLSKTMPDLFEAIGFPSATPEQAAEAQAEMFATLYAPDN